jgi:hypothetical protein
MDSPAFNKGLDDYSANIPFAANPFPDGPLSTQHPYAHQSRVQNTQDWCAGWLQGARNSGGF